MKHLIVILATLCSVSAFAELSATIEPTGQIEIYFENRTDLQISALKLEPYLRCHTTTPQGLGGAFTKTAKADLNYSSTVQDSGSDLIIGEIAIRQKAVVAAPEKEKFFDAQSCGTGVSVKFNWAEISDPNQPNVSDHFLSPIGEVLASAGVFKPKNVDFTQDFTEELKGSYQLIMIDGGQGWCKSLQRRCSLCALGLFKEESGQSQYIGKATNFVRENCEGVSPL